MDKREIRISIFYSDLYVFDLSRHKHRLENMLRQANDFFGKYKLRIDAFPFPYDYMAYQEAFVFAADNGVRPDMGMDLLAKHMREDSARKEELEAEALDANTSADRKLQIKNGLKELRKLSEDRVWEGVNNNAEHDFRMLLSSRAKHTIFKKYEHQWKKAQRLSIVLCEFIWLETKASTNHDTIGQFVPTLTGSTIARYRKFRKPIPSFRQPFVIVDLPNADWHTLAHEIVHGNGHVHPDRGYGGYYDGPQESIMNYFSHGLAPGETILEDVDLKDLEQAFFVRERS